METTVTFTGKLLDQTAAQVAAAASNALNKLAGTFKPVQTGQSEIAHICSDIQHIHMPYPQRGFHSFAIAEGEEWLSDKNPEGTTVQTRSEVVRMIREKVKLYLDGARYDKPITLPDFYVLLTGIIDDELVTGRIRIVIQRQKRT